MKQKVRVLVDTSYGYEFDELLALVKEKQEQGFSDFSIVSGYDGEMELKAYRDETDEEYAKRLEREAAQAIKDKKELEKRIASRAGKLAKDRALYLKLKAEFGE